MDRVRGVRDAAKEGVTRGYTAAKQRVTCTCTKVTWRLIQLGIVLLPVLAGTHNAGSLEEGATLSTTS